MADVIFRKSAALAKAHGYVSPTILQRNLGIGYARASCLINDLRENKIVGKGGHNGHPGRYPYIGLPSYAMKAISIKQPWASMIIQGVKTNFCGLLRKTIETRVWNTDYRGPILIVSSKQPVKSMMEELDLNKDDFVYGHALGIADIVDCKPMVKDDEKAACCEIYKNAFSWFLNNIRPIFQPFQVVGQLKLYDVIPPRCEIIGPDNKVHYRRPFGHPDIDEALTRQGYSVRYVA